MNNVNHFNTGHMHEFAMPQKSWVIRVFAPRPINIPLFVFLSGSVCLLMALAIGLGLGITYHQLAWQVMIVILLTLAGWIVGFLVALGIDRLGTARTGGRLAVINLLSYCSGALVGGIFALTLRTLIPTLYPPKFPPFTLAENAAIIFILISLWLILGLVSNHMTDRAIRQKEYQDELIKNNKELKSSRRQLIAAQELVRQRIAESLHCTANDLFSLSVKLNECKKQVDFPQSNLLKKLDQIQSDLVRLTNQDLRNAMKDLHPGILAVGLPDAVQSLFSSKNKGLKVQFDFDDEIQKIEDPVAPALPDEIRLGLYRFAEESLRNVIKHAQATSLIVSLKIDAGKNLLLSIQDNGKGMESSQPGDTSGLTLMRYGIEIIGGVFTIESRPGSGTLVSAKVPLANY